jgi:hypothetical protein
MKFKRCGRLKQILYLLSFFLFLQLGDAVNAQVPGASWALEFDGNHDVDIAGIVVDSAGNTYAALNYCGDLELPMLKKKLPYGRHVHGLILKINPSGKVLWAHPFKSAFDNRIKDLALAPGGDLLITGFGDGLMHFPGLKDTLKAGIGEEIKNHNYVRHQGLYVARYSPAGERKWVNYWNCLWGEGMSVAVNSKDEVHLVLYHKGDLTKEGKIIDSFSAGPHQKYKISHAVFSAKGGLVSIKAIAYQMGDSRGPHHKIKFDNDGNLIRYGFFSGSLSLSPEVSLVNDAYMDGIDSYLAKYNSKGELLWSKQIGGQHMQSINDIVIAPDNSIYATGHYNYQCILSSGISIQKKSRFEWKSGNSFFYLHLFEDGELDFLRFEDNKGYDSHVEGKSIALGPSGEIHIVGTFNDTLLMEGFQLATWHHNHHSFYSRWEKDKMASLNMVGQAPKGWLRAGYIDINGNRFAGAGSYVGDDAGMDIHGKFRKFTNKPSGRCSFIFGGALKAREDEIIVVSRDSIKAIKTKLISELLFCDNPLSEIPANLWYPKPDAPKLPEGKAILHTPCGSEIKNMEALVYPNPTQSQLNLKLKGMEGSVHVELFTESGQAILSFRAEEVPKEHVISMDVSALSAGKYFIIASNEQYRKALKFIKVR